MSDTGAATDPSYSGGLAAFTVRPARSQQIGPLIGAGVMIVLAVILGLVAILRHDGWGGNYTIYALASAFFAVVMAYFGIMNRLMFTECGPDGIRTRRYGRVRTCQWTDVAEIRQGSVSSRGSTLYYVVVTTRAGNRITLGAPRANSRIGAFQQQLDQIRACWQAAAALAA